MHKIAFAGFRHGHIYSLLEMAGNSPYFEIVACCEEDSETRESLLATKKVAITHDNYENMLATVPCDVIAIGDYYSRRGPLAIRALETGRHVIADKPLCTKLSELEVIGYLAASKQLSVGCMFDLRSSGEIATARRMIAEGILGKITQVVFTAQHPLMRDQRPSWYFDGDFQGGTINDIGCHALDIIPWMVGVPFAKATAAREWQAFEVRSEFFHDAAQCMFELENGCGVMGDLSYSAPASQGFSHSNYWRFTVWGTKGMIEFRFGGGKITAFLDGESQGREIPLDDAAPQGYFDAFIAELHGGTPDLDTACVLESSRNALLLQQEAKR